MSRWFAGAAVAVLAIAVPLAAQDAPLAKMAGTWDFSFETPEGATTWRITFEQVAETLKGSAASDLGTVPLRGTVKGNQFSFGLTINYQGQAYDLKFDGRASEKTAEGTIDVPAATMQMPFSAKRVESSGGTSTPPTVTAELWPDARGEVVTNDANDNAHAHSLRGRV